MAKRVSPGEEKWNPVEAQLVGEVLRPETAAKSRVVSMDAHRAQAAVESQGDDEDQDDEQANEAEQLTREKRVLLMLTRENDLRLTVLASLKSTDRSTLLNTILDDALRGDVVSLRGPLANEGGAGGHHRRGRLGGRIAAPLTERTRIREQRSRDAQAPGRLGTAVLLHPSGGEPPGGEKDGLRGIPESGTPER
jgi:hypothetical protein